MSRIVVLAGRRIDAPASSPPRFPLANRDLVRARITDRLRGLDAAALVASGACGGDLLGHEAAHALGIPGHLVLPFAPERFRETSVVDRPGRWGEVFDAVLRRAVEAGRLIVLEGAGEGGAAYAAAVEAVLDRAAALAATTSFPVVALRVWDGVPRPGVDLTDALAVGARARGFEVEPDVSTL
jgi:hypothetical protein